MTFFLIRERLMALFNIVGNKTSAILGSVEVKKRAMGKGGHFDMAKK
jgi:hypothetical protein